MEFVIRDNDFGHRAGEFCQRVRSELYFFSHFRTDFQTEYRDRFGISPFEDLIGIRIARAKLLLLHGAMSVEEVAERVGFSSIYYFSRIFRARTGVSPSAWISQNKND